MKPREVSSLLWVIQLVGDGVGVEPSNTAPDTSPHFEHFHSEANCLSHSLFCLSTLHIVGNQEPFVEYTTG